MSDSQTLVRIPLAVTRRGGKPKMVCGAQINVIIEEKLFWLLLPLCEYYEKYFIYVSISKLTHDNFNYAGYVDRPKHKLMTKLFEENLFEDTVIFSFRSRIKNWCHNLYIFWKNRSEAATHVHSYYIILIL